MGFYQSKLPSEPYLIWCLLADSLLLPKDVKHYVLYHFYRPFERAKRQSRFIHELCTKEFTKESEQALAKFLKSPTLTADLSLIETSIIDEFINMINIEGIAYTNEYRSEVESILFCAIRRSNMKAVRLLDRTKRLSTDIPVLSLCEDFVTNLPKRVPLEMKDRYSIYLIIKCYLQENDAKFDDIITYLYDFLVKYIDHFICQYDGEFRSHLSSTQSEYYTFYLQRLQNKK